MDFDEEWDAFDVAREAKVFGSYLISRAHNALRKELAAERERAKELQSEMRVGSFLTA